MLKKTAPVGTRRELNFEVRAPLALKDIAKRAQALVKQHSKMQSLTALLKQERIFNIHLTSRDYWITYPREN